MCVTISFEIISASYDTSTPPTSANVLHFCEIVSLAPKVEKTIAIGSKCDNEHDSAKTYAGVEWFVSLLRPLIV